MEVNIVLKVNFIPKKELTKHRLIPEVITDRYHYLWDVTCIGYEGTRTF